MHLTSARDRPTRRPASAGLEWLLFLAFTMSCWSAEQASRPPAPEAHASPTSSTHQALSARLEDAKKALQRDENAAAAAQLEQLVAEIDAAVDRALFLDALLQLAWAQLKQAEYAKSYASYQLLLESSRAAANRLFEARALFGQASIRKNQGSYVDAVRLNRGARTIFEALGDRAGLARTWQLDGILHDHSGEYREALQSYQRARELIDEKDVAYGRLLSEIGITYKNLGDYERAEKVLQSSLEAHRRNADRYGQAQTLLNLSSVSMLLGKNEQAVERCEESLALTREIGERRGQSIVLGNLGDAWWQLGEADRATAAFQQQLALGRELGIRYPQARALESLAAIALERGELEQARSQYSQALDLERQGGASSSEAGILAALSGVALRQSRTAEARELAGRALDLARATERPEAEWQAHLALARALIAGGDVDAALGHLRAGVDIVNSVRGRVLTDTGKVGYLDARQELFHELIAALTRESKSMEALEAAESARGRAFNDLLASRALQPRVDDRPAMASIRETEAQLRAQSRMEVSDPGGRAELTQTRAATEAKIGEQVRSLRVQEPELASFVVAEPVSAAEIRATAQRLRATMVEYLVTRDRLYIWVIPAAGEVHATTVPLDRTRLREVVRELHQRFNSLDATALRDPEPARALLRELYGWTLEPIAAHLPRSHDELVYLIPHDVLLMVPFAALEDGAGRAAVSVHTLATAPSIAVLRYTAEKNRSVAARLNQSRLLAFADPTPPTDAALESLPGARAEVKQISSRFPVDHVLALNGAGASEANAKRLSADRTILHFAVHGLVRDDRPWDSALILSPGDGEDGWLKVGELFDLRLRADLVVLSGCSTGVGKLSGDGILGLARAFMYAGTPSVIVSQWDVSDLSTAFLMERFYDELLAGRSRAGALRAAQLAAQRRFKHPALWAAFQLIGEPL